MKHFPFKYPILLLALLISGSAFSQLTDTLVVYEYVYVTDTVWVEPARDTIIISQLNPIDNATLIIDTTSKKADLVIFSSTGSATIPINCIILSDKQQNFKSMKRIAFLGLTLLALHSSLFAQPNIERNIGIYLRGNYGSQCAHYYFAEGTSYSEEAPNFASAEATAVAGIKGNLPINSFLSFSPRLSYTHIRGLMKSGTGKYPDIDKTNVAYDATATSKFYFLSTDFLLNYYFIIRKQTKYRLYGGLRTDFLVYQNSAGMDLSDANYTGFKKLMFNYVGGIGFDIGKRVYLELEYSNHINNFVNTDYLWVKYGAASINVGYYLF